VVEGAKDVPALMVNQACTTSATCIYLAATNIELGAYQAGYALMSDRCSNDLIRFGPILLVRRRGRVRELDDG